MSSSNIFENKNLVPSELARTKSMKTNQTAVTVRVAAAGQLIYNVLARLREGDARKIENRELLTTRYTILL